LTDYQAYQIDAATLRVGQDIEAGLADGQTIETLFKPAPQGAPARPSEYADPRFAARARRIKKVD